MLKLLYLHRFARVLCWPTQITCIETKSLRPDIYLFICINGMVTGHFVPRSFRTQAFRTILVISYPLLFSIWSFRTQFGHFVPISYPVWSFHTYFYYFLENRFGHFVLIFYSFTLSYPSHFVPILVISYPGHFVPTSELGTN